MNYSVIGSKEKTKDAFEFLLKEYQFKLIKDKDENYRFLLEYQRQNIRVYLSYDYMENRFSFFLVRGLESLPYPPDSKRAVFLYNLFKIFDPDLEFKSFQPDENDYERALHKNAELLKKYGDKILRAGGEIWYW